MFNQYFLPSLRARQWIKNGFIFLPLVFGKKLFVFPANLNTLIAFCLFSLAASSVYLINDIGDIEKDKIHPAKRLRPLAAGHVSTRQAVITASILLALSIPASFLFHIYFGYIVLIYFILNLFYMKILKKIVILDVFSISVFFLLRIISGSIVADVALSHWIIMITMLLALFLGFNKRRQELILLEHKAPHHRRVYAQYSRRVIDHIITVITTAIMISYLLYTVDERTVNEFGSNHMLLTVPFVYYGLSRHLFLVHKGEGDGDPTRILLSDRMMQINVTLWFMVCTALIYYPS